MVVVDVSVSDSVGKAPVYRLGVSVLDVSLFSCECGVVARLVYFSHVASSCPDRRWESL